MKNDEMNGIEEFVSSFTELIKQQNNLFSGDIFDKCQLLSNMQLIKQRRYAITDDIWTLREQHNNSDFIFSLITLIKTFAGEYKKDADWIWSYFKGNASLLTEFSLDILTNKQKKIIDFSRRNDLSSDFITFFSVFAAIPYRMAAAGFISKEIDLRNHNSGFCPVCGHWPVMSYIVGKEGARAMTCICCSTTWSFRRMTCPFCLNKNHDELGYLHIEEESAISAYVCKKCRRYLKTKIVSDSTTLFSLKNILMDYLSSGKLDIASVQNRYITEPLLGTRFQGPEDKHINAYLQKYH